MTAENQNFTMRSGDSLVIEFTVDDGTDPRDITGLEVWWWASPLNQAGQFSSTPKIQKDNVGTGGLAITDGLNGVFQVTLSNADSNALQGEFYHEAQVRDLLGDIYTVAVGTQTIARDLITAGDS